MAEQLKESEMTIHYAISDQTRQIITSNEALKSESGKGFDELKGALDLGFNRLKGTLTDVSISVESLRASFNYGINLWLDQLHMKNGFLDNILNRLDAIHGTFNTPVLSKARELYRIGCKRLANGLLDKALESFHKSEEMYNADFFTQFQLGKLYLYGKNEDKDVIDLVKAEKHLRLAIGYGKREINQLSEMDRWVGETFLHASIACYAQAGDYQVAGKIQEAQGKIKEAAQLVQEAIAIYPQLSESHYYHAKFSAFLGDSTQAILSLERAILLDRNYCIKVQIDKDFDGIQPQVQNLFETLREKAKQDVLGELKKVKRLLSVWVYLSEEAKETQRQINQWSEEVEIALKRGTYFECLNALTILFEAQKTFNGIPYSSFHTINDPSSATCISFSPDGQYLASGSSDKTIKIWEVSLGRLFKSLEGHSNFVISISFSPDGQYLASGSSDKTIKIWEIPSGRFLMSLEGHSKSVVSVSFSPDGQYLASGSGDKTIKIWEIL